MNRQWSQKVLFSSVAWLQSFTKKSMFLRSLWPGPYIHLLSQQVLSMGHANPQPHLVWLYGTCQYSRLLRKLKRWRPLSTWVQDQLGQHRKAQSHHHPKNNQSYHSIAWFDAGVSGGYHVHFIPWNGETDLRFCPAFLLETSELTVI